MCIRNCKFILYLFLKYRWASFLRKFKNRFFFNRTNVTTPIPIVPPPPANNVSELTWIFTTCIVSTQFTDFLAKCIYLFFKRLPFLWKKIESPSFINALYQVWLNWPSGSREDESVQHSWQRQPNGNNNNNDGNGHA